MIREYTTVVELAEIMRLARGTIYNKISSGEWGKEQGIHHIGTRVRIHFETFEAKVVGRHARRRA